VFIENEVRPEVELVNWKRYQPPVEGE